MITKWRFAASVAAPAMLLASLSASQNADAATITFEGTIDQVVGSQNFSLGDTFTGVVDIDGIPVDSSANPNLGIYDITLNNAAFTFDNGLVIEADQAVGSALVDFSGLNRSTLTLRGLDFGQGVAPDDLFTQIILRGGGFEW